MGARAHSAHSPRMPKNRHSWVDCDGSGPLSQFDLHPCEAGPIIGATSFFSEEHLHNMPQARGGGDASKGMPHSAHAIASRDRMTMPAITPREVSAWPAKL